MIVSSRQYEAWIEQEFADLKETARKIGYSFDIAFDYGYDEMIDTDDFIRGTNVGLDIVVSSHKDDPMPSIEVTPIYDDTDKIIYCNVELGFPASLDGADYQFADSLYSILKMWGDQVGKFTEKIMKFEAPLQFLEDFVEDL